MLRRVLLAAAFAAGLAFSASAATQHFHAMLTAKAEVPPTTGKGTGTFAAALDTTTKVLTYTLTFDGLTGPATAAHIHGPAAKGANAGVVVPLGSGAPTSPLSGTTTLTAAQVKDLESGKDYVNVHTDANKGGEIRGQVVHGVLPKPKPHTAAKPTAGTPKSAS
jgi:hypothetical protein